MTVDPGRTAALDAALAAVPLVPVLRVTGADEAVVLGARLAEAGLTVLEVTATTSGWPAALDELRRHCPDVLVGAGTVTTADQARQAVDAGAAFLVSPYPAPPAVAVATERGIPFVEGGFTPGEVAPAAARGIAKLFPAHVGGPSYLRSLLAVLPGARVIPTGGVRLADVPAWLAAGAVAVGVGSDLTAEGDVGARVRDVMGAAR